MTVVVVLYVLIQAVCIGTLPDLATSQRPLSDAAQQFLGAFGASVIAAGALVSVGGTMNAITLAAPRLLFGMSERAQLPGILASTHARFRTPHMAIITSAIVAYGLTLSGSFISSLTISTIIRLVCYAVVCGALPVLRRREDVPAAVTVPGGVAIAIAALVLTGWLLTNTPRAELELFAILAALGVVLYFLFRRRG
jgi:amino acid transporter